MYTQTTIKRECGRGIWTSRRSIYAVVGTKDAKNEGNVSVIRFHLMFVDRASTMYFHQFLSKCFPSAKCASHFKSFRNHSKNEKKTSRKKKLSRRTGNTGKLQHLNPMSDESSQRQGAKMRTTKHQKASRLTIGKQAAYENQDIPGDCLKRPVV